MPEQACVWPSRPHARNQWRKGSACKSSKPNSPSNTGATLGVVPIGGHGAAWRPVLSSGAKHEQSGVIPLSLCGLPPAKKHTAGRPVFSLSRDLALSRRPPRPAPLRIRRRCWPRSRGRHQLAMQPGRSMHHARVRLLSACRAAPVGPFTTSLSVLLDRMSMVVAATAGVVLAMEVAVEAEAEKEERRAAFGPGPCAASPPWPASWSAAMPPQPPGSRLQLRGGGDACLPAAAALLRLALRARQDDGCRCGCSC